MWKVWTKGIIGGILLLASIVLAILTIKPYSSEYVIENNAMIKGLLIILLIGLPLLLCRSSYISYLRIRGNKTKRNNSKRIKIKGIAKASEIPKKINERKATRESVNEPGQNFVFNGSVPVFKTAKQKSSDFTKWLGRILGIFTLYVVGFVIFIIIMTVLIHIM